VSVSSGSKTIEKVLPIPQSDFCVRELRLVGYNCVSLLNGSLCSDIACLVVNIVTKTTKIEAGGHTWSAVFVHLRGTKKKRIHSVIAEVVKPGHTPHDGVKVFNNGIGDKHRTSDVANSATTVE
jgi:hypothetical protein